MKWLLIAFALAGQDEIAPPPIALPFYQTPSAKVSVEGQFDDYDGCNTAAKGIATKGFQDRYDRARGREKIMSEWLKAAQTARQNKQKEPPSPRHQFQNDVVFYLCLNADGVLPALLSK